jgi:hypothetical protein
MFNELYTKLWSLLHSKKPRYNRGHWLRERPDIATFISIKIPIIIRKTAHGENKIHINVKEFSRELAISSSLEERLTHNFGIPFRKKTRPRRTLEERIKLAEDYEKLIKDGSFKSRAELARHLNVSRAWITKVMNIKKQ